VSEYSILDLFELAYEQNNSKQNISLEEKNILKNFSNIIEEIKNS
jgi:uncharacterized membrane protein